MRWLECALCREPCAGDWLCRECGRDLASHLHGRHGHPERLAGHALLSFGRYGGAWASSLCLAKSQPFGSIPRAFEEFLLALARHWAPEVRALGCDAVAAVPSHPLRCLVQSDLSARFAWVMAKSLGVPVLLDVLRFSPRALLSSPQPQKALGRGERLKRERRARFRVDRDASKAQAQFRRVLLVDDVCTTGASLTSCARLLEDTGRSVIALAVLARAE